MAASLSRFLSWRIGILIAAVAMSGFAVPMLHNEYHHSRSDFRDIREFDGLLLAKPIPHVVVARPGETGPHAFSRYVLVGRGKTGPRIDVPALDGKYVRVRGSLIYRDAAETLISVKGATEIPVRSSVVAADSLRGEPLGTHTLRGEILDSKCYYGTMRPGHTTVHRQCAIRCIAGGIPPVFLVKDETGNTLSFFLVNKDGSSIHAQVLPFVTSPIEIQGEVIRLDNLLVLKADPDTYRSLL